MKNGFVLMLMLIQSVNSFAQLCSPDSLNVRSIKAFNTDSNIDWELQNHLVYLNADCIQNGKLVIHLVGSYDSPASTSYFPSLAANNGFKAISLKYPNGTAALTACGDSDESDCFQNFRQEIVFGGDSSPSVSVDTSNCIVNRIQKLLIYLRDNFPTENWDDFLTLTETINWSKVVVSGHSQGGGHAAYIAKTFEVDRVLMFASPNDYSSYFMGPANWISSTSATPDSNYYAFGNLYDNIAFFSNQFQIWNDMNLHSFSDSTLVDGSNCPYNNSRILYTKDESADGLGGNHNSMIIDDFTPLSGETPIFAPVWKYMLGICGAPASIPTIAQDKTGFSVFPNPSNAIVFVECDKPISKVEIFNLSGKRLKVIYPNDSNFQLNLDAYNGPLIMRFTFQDNKDIISKFINLE